MLELVWGRLAARKRGCRVGKWAEWMGEEAEGRERRLEG